MFMRCPKSYMLSKKCKKRTDYPRLSGNAVHDFIKFLYNKRKPVDRPYYFLSVDSARKCWFPYWEKYQKKNADKLVRVKKEDSEKFGGSGWNCIENYMVKNKNSPTPIAIEKRIVITYLPEDSHFGGILIEGILDQTRTVSPRSIAKLRPEVVFNGELSDRYDPVIILDIKSGFNVDFKIPKGFSREDAIRIQTPLQRNLQAAIYSFLYRESTSKWPLMFYLYGLKDNELYPVRGDEPQLQENFVEVVSYVSRNIEEGYFPRHVGIHCKHCDYTDECKGNSNFYISTPGILPTSVRIAEKQISKDPNQLKFKFTNEKSAK